MKRLIPLILLAGGLVLFVLAFIFYQKSESLKNETEILRDIATSAASSSENDMDYTPQPNPEPAYDPADLDQTPPDVTPFIGSTVCLGHWGNHLRQYCNGGDNAPLELIEGGYDQAETMRTLTMCLNELLQRTNTYETDMRPMDSLITLDETNRKNLACGVTEAYGDSPAFNDGSVYYMIKEHMESRNISRLEKP